MRGSSPACHARVEGLVFAPRFRRGSAPGEEPNSRPDRTGTACPGPYQERSTMRFVSKHRRGRGGGPRLLRRRRAIPFRDVPMGLPGRRPDDGPHGLFETMTLGFQRSIYEGLVARDENMKLVGALAERWENVEPNTWRFHLRKGVRFHDGSAFAADDVAFSVETDPFRGLRPQGCRPAHRGDPGSSTTTPSTSSPLRRIRSFRSSSRSSTSWTGSGRNGTTPRK